MHSQESAVIASLSAAFVDFLCHLLDDQGYGTQEWSDQVTEKTRSNRFSKISRAARIERILLSEQGQHAIRRVASWNEALTTGNLDKLTEFHDKFRFICVVGIPRTGGSYLTSELYQALGYNPEAVPAVVAHDGFPDARPFKIGPGNTWIEILSALAQYLTTVEMYFDTRNARPKSGRVVVPKKLTKAVYAGALFRSVFGADAHYFLTVRNPVSACLSTIDKSGGMPAGEKFEARSNIERWAERDVSWLIKDASECRIMDYFHVYVKYWELYHYRMALCGILQPGNFTVVPYEKYSMIQVADQWRNAFGSESAAGDFYIGKPGIEKRSDWSEMSNAAIHRVASVWESVGLNFPVEALLKGY